MKYVYFTKTLQSLDLAGLIAFFKEVGVDGADLAVRPGYPIHPDNALTELPKAAKALHDEGLIIGLVSAATNLNDPESRAAQTLFEAAGKAGIAAVKIGYFPYQGKFDAAIAQARARLAAFANLAAKAGVKCCYHTHSGNNLGSNGAGLRLLLQDLDPHHIGAFVDTGHTAIGGAPIRMELDMVRPWLSLIAIKDIAWSQNKQGWQHRVVPAGNGIVRWKEVGTAVKECRFNGTISLHAEYEVKDLAERKESAKQELVILKQLLG